jgi:two-component system OmpR family sensor kinase
MQVRGGGHVAEQTLSLRLDSAAPLADAAAYRGPDRRAGRATAADRAGSTRGASYVVFLVATNVVVLGVASAVGSSFSVRADTTDWLTASVAVVAALAGAIELMRWRLVGDAVAVWVGTALLVYSAATIAFPGLLRSFGSDHAQSWDDLVRPSSAFVVMALLAIAAAGPDVDARLRPKRALAVAAGIGVVGLVAAAMSVDVRLLLGPPIDHAAATSALAFGQVGAAVLWLGLGAAFLLRSSPDDAARPWVGVFLLGLAEARLSLAVSVTRDPSWLLASQLFRVFGVAAVLAGAVQGLHVAFAQQRTRLLDSLVELSSARAQQQAAEATAEERAHDLRAALLGIGSAAVTLERYHHQISDDERASLTCALSAEIARLQHFVAANEAQPEAFELADALLPMLSCARARGAQIDCDLVAADVVGRRGEVAEAVQNVVDNACRHAPGSPITVRAEQRDGLVLLRVEDRGPGVADEHKRHVFERGWRRDASQGSGLGLHVAARLVGRQHGDLWVEDRPGGGASFVLALPAAGGSTEG